MKPEPSEKPQSLYNQAWARAGEVLKLPTAEIYAKLKVKSDWKEDRLPNQEELTILILKWSTSCP